MTTSAASSTSKTVFTVLFMFVVCKNDVASLAKKCRCSSIVKFKFSLVQAPGLWLCPYKSYMTLSVPGNKNSEKCKNNVAIN
jgi:hypothetical protein